MCSYPTGKTSIRDCKCGSLGLSVSCRVHNGACMRVRNYQEDPLEHISSPHNRSIDHAPGKNPQQQRTLPPASHHPCSAQQKKKGSGHISANKHLSGTAVNITGLIEQEAKQGDHSRLEMNRWGEGGWGEATQGDWVRRQEGMVEQNNEGLCEILH